MDLSFFRAVWNCEKVFVCNNGHVGYTKSMTFEKCHCGATSGSLQLSPKGLMALGLKFKERGQWPRNLLLDFEFATTFLNRTEEPGGTGYPDPTTTKETHDDSEGLDLGAMPVVSSVESGHYDLMETLQQERADGAMIREYLYNSLTNCDERLDVGLTFDYDGEEELGLGSDTLTGAFVSVAEKPRVLTSLGCQLCGRFHKGDGSHLIKCHFLVGRLEKISFPDDKGVLGGIDGRPAPVKDDEFKFDVEGFEIYYMPGDGPPADFVVEV